MEFWINVKDRFHNIIGNGPITTAYQFSQTRKLNEMGNFSFTMPVTDPQSSLLLVDERRIVECCGVIDNQIEVIGGGIVDSRKSKLVSDGTLVISGPDLLFELTDRLLRGLAIYSESTIFPVVIYWEKIDGVNTFEVLEKATDGNYNTSDEILLEEAGYYLLIGAEVPFSFVDMAFETPSTADEDVNWGFSDPRPNIEKWRSPSNLIDGTNSFQQSGTIEFTRPTNWTKRHINGQDKYWIRADPEKELEPMAIAEVLCRYRDIRSDDLTELLPFMPEGWHFDPEWQTATVNGTYHIFSEENCLEGLIRLHELHRENFRLGNGRQIQWLGSVTHDSGLIAIQAPDSHVERTKNVAYIYNFHETINLDVASLLYSSGAGNAGTRVSLADCPIEPPPPYVLNRAEGCLENTATTAAYGLIERAESFSDITPSDRTAANDAAASTMLLHQSVSWLEQRSKPLKSYDVTLIAPPIRVGESVYINYPLVRNGLVRQVTGDFVVMEATTKIDKNGIHTESLKISNITRKVPDDGTLITKLMRQVKTLTSHNQPLSANLVR